MSALSVTLGCDITALRKAMASAVDVVSASAGRMASLTRKSASALAGGLGTAMKVGMGGMLAGGVGSAALLVKSIGKAAEMEGFETAFVPLLGGIKEAKERMADLAEFAKVTPFELPEVVQASRMLEVLTKGALATSDGLRLVGDAAAIAQQPFPDVAMWVGRLYDGLQSGRPVGEATMRLQEMGLISGEVRNRIEELQKSGAAGPAVWDAARRALSRFSGGMEMQSKTWIGKMSNLSDAIGQVMVKLGTPIIDALKPYLDGVIAKVESLKASAAAMGEQIKTALDTLRAAWDTGNMAELIGSGIVLGVINGINAFSSGIRKSMAYLGAAMAEIMASARDSWNMQEFLGMFKNVGRALASTITEAILKALDALPGLDLTDDVQREAANARNNWNTAKNRLEDFNGAEAVQGAIDAIRRANQKGEEAASKAGNGNVIDPTTAANSYKAIYDKLKARIDAQRSADEIFGEILADIDKKKSTSDTPAAGTDKPEISRLDPIVTSLAKVGGGGYSTGLLDMQRENNRLTGETNQHLKDIKERVSKGYGGSQVAAFA
jgi:hypothetical protein